MPCISSRFLPTLGGGAKDAYAAARRCPCCGRRALTSHSPGSGEWAPPLPRGEERLRAPPPSLLADDHVERAEQHVDGGAVVGERRHEALIGEIFAPLPGRRIFRAHRRPLAHRARINVVNELPVRAVFGLVEEDAGVFASGPDVDLR